VLIEVGLYLILALEASPGSLAAPAAAMLGVALVGGAIAVAGLLLKGDRFRP
jgi:hypothetical protein